MFSELELLAWQQGDKNCLLSNWKTPTEFQNIHLDQQINNRNGKHMNVEEAPSLRRVYSICIY